jgi:hypothetical protein
VKSVEDLGDCVRVTTMDGRFLCAPVDEWPGCSRAELKSYAIVSLLRRIDPKLGQSVDEAIALK